jgi:diguanylate cyclase (GGDEF)-like protein
MQEAPKPDADIVPDIDLLVREDKVNLLFRQSFPAVFISYATALLLSWILRGHASDVALLTWLGVLAVSTLGRLAVFITYFQAKPRGAELLKLERRYGITLMLSSLIWGIGALVVIPADSLVHQAITLFFLVGMAGGAVSVYSARYPMAAGAMMSVLLPSTVWLFSQSGKERLGLAIGASMFIVIMLRTAKEMADALRRNYQLSRELHAAHAAADQQAKTDQLTGLNNRRAFLDHGEQLVRYCERHDLEFAALVMDIDHFKTINDTLGHLAGDTVLRQVGDIIGNALRRSDICGRIGGEEFAAVLPHTSEDGALGIAEKLRRSIADMSIECAGQRLKITISIGVAAGMHDLAALLAHADKAMYRAKAQGRNQVVRYEDAYLA